MKILTNTLVLMAGIFLVYAPGNIAADALTRGCESLSTIVMYAIGIFSLLGASYRIGVEAGIEKHERFIMREVRRKAREGKS